MSLITGLVLSSSFLALAHVDGQLGLLDIGISRPSLYIWVIVSKLEKQEM